MRPVLLLLAAGALGAADSLLTDLRVVVGSNQRSYSTGDVDDRFDRAATASLAFVYGFRPLTPEGTWFVGGAGRFATAEDSDGSDGLTGTYRRMMADALAGYAFAPPEFDALHVEVGPYAGLGLARARFVQAGTARSDIVPAIEGGVRVAGYFTWSGAVQLGLEAEYGLVLSRPAITDAGAGILASQGFAIAIGIGTRIH